MFLSAKMPNFEFEVKPNDVLQLFLIVKLGWDTMHGPLFFNSIFRPVCRNTVGLAQNWAEKNTDGNGRGIIWKGKSTSDKLLEHLGYWMKHVVQNASKEQDLLKEFYALIAKTPVKSQAHCDEILYTAFPDAQDISPFYPVELRPAKSVKIADFNDGQAQLRDGISGLFAGAGTAITPDFYGISNAGSEFLGHYLPSKRPIAGSMMWGSRSKLQTRLMRVLKEEAYA
jgi:hypothetical protein